MTMNLKLGERIDALHRNGYRIIQNPENFCFGMDAVLITGFANVKDEENVLDLGTGTGIIPILLEAKTKARSLKGLEIQKDSVDMAKRSVTLNGLDNKIEIVEGDIKEAPSIFGKSSFDVVITNPPYMNMNKGLVSEKSAKAIARHEILCTLKDVITVASKVVRPGGRFYMVHRPHRLVEIIAELKEKKLEPKRIRFVHSYIDKEATMVLIEAVRNGNSMVKIQKPLIIYNEENVYSKEIYDIYNL